MKVWVAGAWRDILSAKVRMSGAWRPLAAVKIYSGAAWQDAGTFDVATTGTGGGGGGTRFRVDVSPQSSSVSAASSTVTSGLYRATPSRGVAPFTYSWVVATDDGSASFTINTPTLAQTTVTASGIPTLTQATCVIRCTCTDAVGNTDFDDAGASLTNTTI